MRSPRNLLFSILLISLSFVTTACITLPPMHDLPPIVSQSDLSRPYETLGRVQASRQVYGIVDYQLTPDIRDWGLTAIREEAAKMGADAVILPEVTGHTITYLVMPTTEYRATGVAIKFK